MEETNKNSVCLASIMRLIAVVQQSNDADMTWNLVNQAIWANTEADFAIVSGMHITYPKFLSLVTGFVLTLSCRLSTDLAAGLACDSPERLVFEAVSIVIIPELVQ